MQIEVLSRIGLCEFCESSGRLFGTTVYNVKYFLCSECAEESIALESAMDSFFEQNNELLETESYVQNLINKEKK